MYGQRDHMSQEALAQLDELVAMCLGRFRQGLGASVDWPGGGTVYLVPEALVRDGALGLVIGYEGHGVFRYDGQRPMNEFRLLKAGFPMLVAKGVAVLVNGIVAGMSGASRAQIGHMPSEENET